MKRGVRTRDMLRGELNVSHPSDFIADKPGNLHDFLD